MADKDTAQVFPSPATARLELLQRFEQAWASGQAVPVETYLKRNPDLSQDSALVVELIVAEFRLRSQKSSAVSPENYFKRFPQYRELLAVKLQPGQLPSGSLVGGETTLLPGSLPAPTVSAPSPAPVDWKALPAPMRQFADTLCDLQLLNADQLNELAPVAQQAPDVPALAEVLAQRGWITAYQAEQVRQGSSQQLLFGPYLLLEPLGKGGMGQVFKARHQLMKRVVALKIIRQGHLPHAQAVQRFQQEIEIAAQLAHPNIVTAHDAGRAGDCHYLVMEYVEGEGLDTFLEKQSRLPVGQACDIIRQAALGLQHAHERGLIHRDIKPANLLLAHEGGAAKGEVVKILDMGLARVRYDPTGKGSKSLTQMGAIMGSPDYIAPEQILDCSRVDGRADIYSLGCTFYQLLTGQVPFDAETLSGKLDQHLHSQPRPAATLCPALPPEVAAILDKMMARQPEQRYASAGDVAAALAPFCNTAAGAETAGESPPMAIPMALAGATAGPASGQLISRLLLAGVLAVVLLAPLAWFIFRPQPKQSDRKGQVSLLQPPDSFTNSIGMKLRRIPTGKFLMGSPESESKRQTIEGPQHEVTISRPFYMGSREVTVGQFRTFVKDSGYVIPLGVSGIRDTAANWENPGWTQGDEFPVSCVSWEDARAFCDWLSKKEGKKYRLPTEAEWEYCCRAGTTTAYSCGDSTKVLPDYAWTGKQRMPQPVGGRKANPWGLYDMHGNIAEWVADRTAGKGYSAQAETDPLDNATDAEWYIGRGGSWSHSTDNFRSACRITSRQAPPQGRFTWSGFRVVCEAEGVGAQTKQ